MDPVISDIRREWTWVKYGVEEIIHKYPWLTYRAEDIYAACVNGQAILYTTSEAFAVCTVEVHPITAEQSFLVWACWANGKGKNLNIIKNHFDFIRREAERLGCDRVSAKTPNKALERVYTRNGWRCDMRDFSIDIEDTKEV
tara:strand:- start:179 stop:604 length:426 start_codon:yes stop_codon:yes gene_type:complete